MAHQEGVFPSPSKILEQRRMSEDLASHRRRLQSAKPVVDTRAPADYLHLHVKLKKMQVDAERQKQIQNENMRLLTRMEDIVERNPQGDKNIPMKRIKSLNIEKRRTEQARVDAENQRLFHKLLRAMPRSSAIHWWKDWEAVNPGSEGGSKIVHPVSVKKTGSNNRNFAKGVKSKIQTNKRMNRKESICNNNHFTSTKRDCSQSATLPFRTQESISQSSTVNNTADAITTKLDADVTKVRPATSSGSVRPLESS